MSIYNQPETKLANFQIVSGWPGDTVLEQQLVPDTGETIERGDIVMLEANGKIKKATLTQSSGNEAKATFFAIDKTMTVDSFTCIKGNIIIDTYNIDGTLAVNDKVTASNGQFKKDAGTDIVVGKVIRWDAGAKKARIVWTKND